MFSKIQQYLLLNKPLLWNIKIVPAGLVIIILNLFFFIMGLSSGDIDFKKPNYYQEDTHAIFYLITILTSIIFLILWLISYLKNNAFKSFYPKKSSSLYWEWLSCFLLISGNFLYSFSYYQGTLYKERNFVSEKEAHRVISLLKKVEILLPESDYSYYKRFEVPENYHSSSKDSVSISLLNFNVNYYGKNGSNIRIVKKWLNEEKKDSIRLLMSQYLDLQKKYKLRTNLTVDKWMDIVYNPPHYPISSSKYIYKNYTPSNDTYYVEYNNLYNGYYKILNAYSDSEETEKFILAIIYMALCFSILLFSFRITSGKSWLISIVIAGLLCFLYGITIAIYETTGGGNKYIDITTIYWTFIFIIMSFYSGAKIIYQEPKGKSSIIINLSFWFIPVLPLLYYLFFMDYYKYNTKSYSSIYQFFDDNPTVILWINLIFVIIFLFFCMKIVKRWRALPEE